MIIPRIVGHQRLLANRLHQPHSRLPLNQRRLSLCSRPLHAPADPHPLHTHTSPPTRRSTFLYPTQILFPAHAMLQQHQPQDLNTAPRQMEWVPSQVHSSEDDPEHRVERSSAAAGTHRGAARDHTRRLPAVDPQQANGGGRAPGKPLEGACLVGTRTVERPRERSHQGIIKAICTRMQMIDL